MISYMIRVFIIFSFALLYREQTHLLPHHISYKNILGYDSKVGKVYEWHDISRYLQELKIKKFNQPNRGLSIRWLGTFGFELSDGTTSLLIDPFVSRPTPKEQFRPLHIDTDAVNHYVLRQGNNSTIKAVLVTHSHYDHIQDVPYILSQYLDNGIQPILIGNKNTEQIIQSYNKSDISWIGPNNSLEKIQIYVTDFSSKENAHNQWNIGRFKITAFQGLHPQYDFFSWRGPSGLIESTPPFYVWDYKLNHNESIGFLIEYGGLKIYFSDSPFIQNPKNIGKVDILIQTIASREMENNIAECIKVMEPIYYIPAHYDNFFKPLDEFSTFDPVIGFGFPENIFGDTETHLIDFAHFDSFITEFENEYKTQSTELRLLKLLYYYSIESLVLKK